MWAAIIMLRRRLVSFSISAAWVRRGDTFPRLKPLLSQTTLQLVLKSTVTGIIMQQSVLYPCSIKTLEVLGNPSPMPKRFPETLEGRGGGFPNNSRVLVECGHSIHHQGVHGIILPCRQGRIGTANLAVLNSILPCK